MSFTAEKLAEARAWAATLRLELVAQFGDDLDPELLEGTIEGETDFFELIGKIIREIKETAAYAEGLNILFKRLSDKMARYEEREEKLRELVKNSALQIGVLKHKFPDFSYSVHDGRAPLECDVAAWLDEKNPLYTRTKTSYEIDKVKVREDLEKGVEIPWARLGQKPKILTIK